MAPPAGGHRGAAERSGFLRPKRVGAGFSRRRQVLVLFSHEAILCLRPGPAPAASIRTPMSGGWVHCRGRDKLFNFKGALRDNHRFRRRRLLDFGMGRLRVGPGTSSALALDAFLDCVDPGHKPLLAQLEHHSWPVYAALCRAPGMDQLLNDNTGLAVALSNHATLAERPVQWPMRTIRRLLNRGRRRDIAAALGWPNRQASVRLLARLTPDAASVAHLCALRELAHDPRWGRRLGHLPRIDVDILRLLSNPVTRQRCEMSFLLELAATEDCLHLSGTVERMIGHFAAAGRTPPQLRSVEQVIGLVHEGQALDRSGRHRLGRFGPPPLPGNEHIIALTSSAELDREARAQRNCLAGEESYEQGIADGELWIYRVNAPERCTLAIAREDEEGPWSISELHTRGNGHPSQLTVFAVERWLQACNATTEADDTFNSADVDSRQLALALDNCGL